MCAFTGLTPWLQPTEGFESLGCRLPTVSNVHTGEAQAPLSDSRRDHRRCGKTCKHEELSCWPELCCFILCKEDSTGMQHFCRNDLGANVHTCCSEPASLGIIYFTPHPTPVRGWRLSVIPRVCLIFSGFASFGWRNGRGGERMWEKAKKEPKKDALLCTPVSAWIWPCDRAPY